MPWFDDFFSNRFACVLAETGLYAREEFLAPSKKHGRMAVLVAMGDCFAMCPLCL